MAFPRKRRANSIHIYEDPAEPFPANTPETTQEREGQLALILKESTGNTLHHTVYDVERLNAISNFKTFFRSQVKVTQHQIDAYCGFSNTSSKRARRGESIAGQIDTREIVKDNRGGHNRRLTKVDIDKMDYALEYEGWLARRMPWLELASWYAGIDNIDVKVIRRAMNERGWYSFRPARKCRQWPRHRLLRLRAFHEVYQFWRDAQFGLVRYSDEKHFGEVKDNVTFIRRKLGTRYDPQNLKYDPARNRDPSIPKKKKDKKPKEKKPPTPPPQQEDDSTTPRQFGWRHDVWACVGLGYKSPLIFYRPGNSNGAISYKVYINQILEPVVGTWAPGDWILEEDRAAGHGLYPLKGKKKKKKQQQQQQQDRQEDEEDDLERVPLGVQSWQDFEKIEPKRLNAVTRWKVEHKMRWIFNVPNSPDMAPIENCWKFLGQKYLAMGFIPPTEEASEFELNRIWEEELKQEWIDNLIIGKWCKKEGKRINSMVDRWEDLKECNGEPTGY